MAGRIRRHDWSGTPLGAMRDWPQSLRTLVGLMVSSPSPQALLWGPGGTLLYNDAYALFAGSRHPHLLGRPHAQAWPEIADFNESNLRRALAGEAWSLRDVELTLDRGAGLEPAWLDVDYVPARDDDATPQGFIAFVNETTERRRAQLRADTERDRQRDMLRQMPGFAAVLVGPDHCFDWFNDAYQEISGGRAREGATVREIFPELESQGFFSLLDRVYETGEPFVARAIPVDLAGRGPRRLNFVYEAVRDESGAISGIFVGGYDVTDMLEATAALGESETRYQALFQSTETGFCIIELKFEGDRAVDYRIVEGNQAYERMTGLHGSTGKWVSQIAPGLERHWFDLYGDVARTGTPARFEQEAAIFGKWYDVQALRIGERDQNRVAILFNDVTQQRQAQTRHRVLLELNDAVRDLTDAEEIAHASSRILAEALNVSRVGYGVMDTEAETITIARDWNAPGVKSIAGVIRFRDFGDYIENLAKGEVVVFADAADDPRVTDGGAALDTISARALINLPLMEQGKVVALLFVNNATPRAWTDEDVALVREVAERVRAGSERARTAAALKESEGRLRFLDDLTTAAQSAIDPEEILSILTRMTARHLGVTNCAYADMDPDQDGFTIRGDWAAPGTPSIVGHYSLADFGRLAVQELGAGRPLIINDNLREIAPEEAATFQAIGVSATICMPLVKEGRLLALMAVHHKDPHVWTHAELATIREVTTRCWAHIERVRDEIALAESEARYRALFEAMDEGFCIIEFVDGPRGEFDDYVHVLANDAYVTNAGIPDVVGQHVRDMVPDEAEEWIDLYREVLVTGRSIRFEKELEATGRWLELAAFRVEPVERRQVAVLFKDLTARKLAERALEDLNTTLEERVDARTRELASAHEALRQSQKMEAVGQLTGGIAHDFNNLLAGISGSLELLGKRLSEGRLNGMERYIEAAQASAQRAAALTQRLLAFSRRQTLDPKPTDVNRLIAGMEDLIRRSVGPVVDVEVVQAGGLWATRVDQSQLENALLNLCINGRDAMAPKGGRLTIETANKWLDERHARERDLAPGQYISLCVTDTGSGMSPEVIERIFDPFFTTKPIGQGTGLGLSMIHGFVRQSGGQVRVYSEVGSGTTMCLYLPRFAGEAPEEDPVQVALAGAPGHGETVLVIDDEPTVRMLVLEVLREQGYAAIEAADGPTGLAILQSDVRIDLLITDVGLPGGLNGRQVADAARETRPDLKVLFITGYAENAAVGNGLLAHNMQVLTKPFVMADLAAKVTEMIDG
ncbi:MAG TPA: GAF domain-containing protein [Brevundimonas sp.]|jgi:signal transduction histidine kinase/putative methionine-R-sulfoxide reductase with GAF domain|uniref:GAF domain-containing protein n=1 Tax=Brevundimonas sp. TaxID=1871086 RepID=UPI002DE9006A|nr:GAF domain-containing protein [Brevundimonas sp.]